MSEAGLAYIIVGVLAGVIVSMIGAWAKTQIERLGSVEARADQRNDVQTERVIDHTADIARLQAQVEMLTNADREERNRCAELAERVARGEAFQAWAEPIIEKLVALAQSTAEFQARFDERLVTLFKGQAAILSRMERLLPAR